MALALSQGGTSRVTLVDCDVEQPNDVLFIKPGRTRGREVPVPTPEFNEALCTGCGQCASACRFGAIAVVRGKRLFFPELCHGCGACWEVCGCGATTRSSRTVGHVFEAPAEAVRHLRLVWGQLDIGQPLAPPIIKAAKDVAARNASGPIIHDAPPGTACPLVETLRDIAFCLLVTEPTPFGLHDLTIAHQVTSTLAVPSAVVINRTGISDAAPLEDFCVAHDLPILLRIPFSARVAKVLSNGGTLLDADQSWESALNRLWLDCRRRAASHGKVAQ